MPEIIVTAPSPSPSPAASDPYDAAQLGINWLSDALCRWMQTEGQQADCTTGTVQSCMGCHVQAEPVLGLARSAKRCYRLPTTACSQPADESPLEYVTRFIAGCQRKDCIVGPFSAACGAPAEDPTTVDGRHPNLGSIGHYPDCGSNAPPASVHPMIQSAHGGLALVGYSSSVSARYAPNLVALADWFVSQQDPSGKWIPDRYEAPIDQGELFTTGSAVMALKLAAAYADAGRAATYDAAMRTATTWVRTAPRATNQDRTFAILALVETGSGGSDPDLVGMMDEVVAAQNADGGWSERAGLQSNAYATGQALYALIQAGEPLDNPSVCAGVGWLVSTQNADGSWTLGTPGVATDSSRNSAFTATIWPVLALGQLRRWGAKADPDPPGVTSCADREVFAVTVRHAADTACGLYSLPDTYDLTVYSDFGDFVEVSPSSVDLASGGSSTVTVTWHRGAARPPGTVTNVVLQLASRGAAAAGCPVYVAANMTVTEGDDTIPGPLGFGLRARKAGADLELSWTPLPGAIGSYELVSMQRAARDDTSVQPVKGLLDVGAARTTVPPSQSRLTLAGELAPAPPELVFYKVRATSPCTLVPGPTCNFTCADPEPCHARCR